jgi:hypothetical protein
MAKFNTETEKIIQTETYMKEKCKLGEHYMQKKPQYSSFAFLSTLNEVSGVLLYTYNRIYIVDMFFSKTTLYENA